MILQQYSNLNIDLFPGGLNHQLSVYALWKPDPGYNLIDAFSCSWRTYKFYGFIPFSLIPKCVKKIQLDKAICILVVPLWPTQTRFPECYSCYSISFGCSTRCKLSTTSYTQTTTSTPQRSPPIGVSCFWRSIDRFRLLEDITNFTMRS